MLMNKCSFNTDVVVDKLLWTGIKAICGSYWLTITTIYKGLMSYTSLKQYLLNAYNAYWNSQFYTMG